MHTTVSWLAPPWNVAALARKDASTTDAPAKRIRLDAEEVVKEEIIANLVKP